MTGFVAVLELQDHARIRLFGIFLGRRRRWLRKRPV
jgi:hypothetical protein